MIPYILFIFLASNFNHIHVGPHYLHAFIVRAYFGRFALFYAHCKHSIRYTMYGLQLHIYVQLEKSITVARSIYACVAVVFFFSSTAIHLNCSTNTNLFFRTVFHYKLFDK